tara:strand:+ start:4161 stop:4427 length:267 start_codon:yes stop_codon:yes gene_type:complete
MGDPPDEPPPKDEPPLRAGDSVRFLREYKGVKEGSVGRVLRSMISATGINGLAFDLGRRIYEVELSNPGRIALDESDLDKVRKLPYSP